MKQGMKNKLREQLYLLLPAPCKKYNTTRSSFKQRTAKTCNITNHKEPSS